MRRKPYILTGWFLILALLLLTGILSEELTAQSWIGLSMMIQFCVMLADVPGKEGGEKGRKKERKEAYLVHQS